MKYLDLLTLTAKEFLDNCDYNEYLTKTKLLKLTYLVEYFYYKKEQVRLTDVEWVFLYYGPYIYDYEKFLEKCPFSIEFYDQESSDFKIIIRDEAYIEKEHITDFEIKMLIKRIIGEYGRKDLNEILDFIYFDTEPMLYVSSKHSILDFLTVMPEEKPLKILGKNEINTILDKYKEKLKNVRAI
jgi:hypothetical protein